MVDFVLSFPVSFLPTQIRRVQLLNVFFIFFFIYPLAAPDRVYKSEYVPRQVRQTPCSTPTSTEKHQKSQSTWVLTGVELMAENVKRKDWRTGGDGGGNGVGSIQGAG